MKGPNPLSSVQDEGFFDAPQGCTGYFGDYTKEALIRWQEANEAGGAAFVLGNVWSPYGWLLSPCCALASARFRPRAVLGSYPGVPTFKRR